jgi:hypothetical protein
MDHVNKANYHATVVSTEPPKKNRISSKNSREKKLLNSWFDLGQLFLATALIVQGSPVAFLSASALPGLHQLATPCHHYGASVNPHTARNTIAFYSSIILNKIKALQAIK